jgi:hypothetical protein
MLLLSARRVRRRHARAGRDLLGVSMPLLRAASGSPGRLATVSRSPGRPDAIAAAKKSRHVEISWASRCPCYGERSSVEIYWASRCLLRSRPNRLRCNERCRDLLGRLDTVAAYPLCRDLLGVSMPLLRKFDVAWTTGRDLLGVSMPCCDRSGKGSYRDLLGVPMPLLPSCARRYLREIAASRSTGRLDALLRNDFGPRKLAFVSRSPGRLDCPC